MKAMQETCSFVLLSKKTISRTFFGQKNKRTKKLIMKAMQKNMFFCSSV